MGLKQPRRVGRRTSKVAVETLAVQSAAIAARAVYVDAIRRTAPALAEIFAEAVDANQPKALADRSTEELIAQIDTGRFLAEIARLWRVPASKLHRWIAADSDRLARASAARRNQAALWDWVALQMLLHAPSDRVEIARAEKIAQHCRWRARLFDRDGYGQNIKVTQVDERDPRALTTQELEMIIRQNEVLPD